MKKFFSKNWPLIILLVLAMTTRFAALGSPAEVVFDEVHFGKFVSGYFTGEYYFDIHPPTGKLLIAGFAGLFGFTPGFDFDHIGKAFEYKTFIILRFLPALFGALLALVIYALIRVLGLSQRAAFLGGFLVIFDNALLVESKFIFVDLFFLVFGFAALYFFVRAERTGVPKNRLWFWLVAGLFSGLSASIKWTGLAFPAIIIAAVLFGIFRPHRIKEIITTSTLLIIAALFVYASSFWIHFQLLPQSGPGDAFMSQAFQDELKARAGGYEPAARLTFLQKFIELHKAMYRSNAGLTAPHPDGSRWYEWPLMKKPIYYWVNTRDGAIRSIYLLGNPAVWWLTSLSVATLAAALFVQRWRRRITPLIYLLLFSYGINLLPFIFITRVAFLYHYLPALIFAIIMLVLFAEKFLFSVSGTSHKSQNTQYGREIVFAGLLLFVVIGFLAVAPFSYGMPLKPETHDGYQTFMGFLH